MTFSGGGEPFCIHTLKSDGGSWDAGIDLSGHTNGGIPCWRAEKGRTASMARKNGYGFHRIRAVQNIRQDSGS